jgi:hypothetical protein
MFLEIRLLAAISKDNTILALKETMEVLAF